MSERVQRKGSALYDSEGGLIRDQYGQPVIPDREHLPVLNASDTRKLRAWLERPNGSLIVGPRWQYVAFESVEGGGIMVRTQPYRYVPPEGI